MTESAATLSESDQLQQRIAAMDSLMAEGKAAMAKVNQFYREHDLVPGLGEKVLTSSEMVPPEHRHIFRKLLAELSQIEQRIEEFNPASTKPSPVPVSTRAIGNRYRI